jgi:hypothetical protein
MEEIVLGEIVLFRRAGRLFAHRVLARVDSAPEAYLATRGDRMRRSDPLVTRLELLGRVMYIEGQLGLVQPRRHLNAAEWLLSCLLRLSDRVTCLYVRSRASKQSEPQARYWLHIQDDDLTQ